MIGCEKCKTVSGLVFLVLGVLFLLKDLSGRLLVQTFFQLFLPQVKFATQWLQEEQM